MYVLHIEFPLIMMCGSPGKFHELFHRVEKSLIDLYGGHELYKLSTSHGAVGFSWKKSLRFLLFSRKNCEKFQQKVKLKCFRSHSYRHNFFAQLTSSVICRTRKTPSFCIELFIRYSFADYVQFIKHEIWIFQNDSVVYICCIKTICAEAIKNGELRDV